MTDSDDDYMPALPPELASLTYPSKPGTSDAPTRSAIIGPARPTAQDLSVPIQPGVGLEEEDDDGYGPKPLPSGAIDLPEVDVRTEWAMREAAREEREKAQADKKLERPEWMIRPPENLGFSVGDPTKLKKRGFIQTNRPHKGGSGTGGKKDSSIWTETPEERQKRMEDEVLGKRKRAYEEPEEPESDGERRRRKRNADIEAKVKELQKETRKETLVEKHRRKLEEEATDKKRKKERKEEKEKDRKDKKKKKKKKHGSEEEDEDETPPKIWDYERDMGLKGRLMDEKSRNKYISGARDLGSKFGGGSYL